MTWGKILQPDLVLGDSVMKLTVDILHEHNIKGLVLDVDETLVPITAINASPELTLWVEEIKPVVSLWLASNNLSETRIGRIAESLDLPYITGAAKPSRRKLRRASRTNPCAVRAAGRSICYTTLVTEGGYHSMERRPT